MKREEIDAQAHEATKRAFKDADKIIKLKDRARERRVDLAMQDFSEAQYGGYLRVGEEVSPEEVVKTGSFWTTIKHLLFG